MLKTAGTSPNPKRATRLLALSLFFSGASGLVFEYILGAVSSHLLGDSIFQFSLIVGIMMLSMGAAVYLQRYISDRSLLLKFAVLETMIALIGGFAPLGLYAIYSISPGHFPLFQYVSSASLGLMIGLEIPLVLRINKQYNPDLKQNIANVFSWDYVGGAVGTVVWLVLLSRVPINTIAFLAAGANFTVAMATILYLSPPVAKVRLLRLSPLLAVIALLLLGGFKAESWNAHLEAQLYDDPIAFAKQTRYQRIVVTQNPAIDDWRCYINGNLQFSSIDERIYHEQLVHPAATLSGSPKRALVLGGGDGLAVRELLKYDSIESITLVDLDPQMTRLARDNPAFARINDHALKDARVLIAPSPTSEGEPRDIILDETLDMRASVSVMNIDAAKFLEMHDAAPDIVILDFPDPSSAALAKLYGREFYRRLWEKTPEDVIVAVQSTSPYHAKEAFLCIGRTLISAGWDVMPYQDNVPSFGQWGWYLGWKPESGMTRMTALAAFMETEKFDVETSYLTPQKFLSSTVFGKGAFETEYTTINTASQPHLVQHYLRDSWKIE